MAKKLVVLAGPDEGRAFSLGGEPVLLGRSRATGSHLIDPHVSRVHCQVELIDGQFILTDYDSAGGTFVNGKRISRHTLQSGDLLRIGNTRLQFMEDDGSAAPEAPPQEGPDEGPEPGATIGPEGIPLARPVRRPPPVSPATKVGRPPQRRPGAWAQDLPGTKILHYKIGPLLAKGKSGFVFHARDTRRNVAVALKVLDPEFSQSESAVKRFVQAMKSVLPLRHPNLVKVVGAGKTGPNCWVAMEYVHGESLAAVIGRIETAGMLDWRQVLRVGIFLARALVYAHQKNLLHQSVTPPNILIGKTMNETKLADLMLATATEEDPTKPISAAGVPSEELSYMPPERTDGPGKPVDARADIYSLGAILYAMFTGHPPLGASTVKELVTKIRLESPVSLKSHQLGLPEELEQIVQQMLAKRPQDRQQTAKEVLAQLEGVAKANKVTV